MTDLSLWWLLYIAIGMFVGIFAGMLGIGGGMVIVPLLAVAFDAQGIDTNHILHLAVGTAMASIVFTSLSSMRAHASRNSVRWDIVLRMTPGILLGSIVGTYLAKYLPTRVLAIYFAGFVFLMAINMLVDLKPKGSKLVLEFKGLSAAGFIISGLSALIAMGGAVLTVPLMLYMEVSMVQAIGTAAAIGFPIAVGGTAGYFAAGSGVTQLPPLSFGYVYLPALGGIAVASIFMAPFGAHLAHKLPAKLLRKIFAVLLCALAMKMLVSLW